MTSLFEKKPIKIWGFWAFRAATGTDQICWRRRFCCSGRRRPKRPMTTWVLYRKSINSWLIPEPFTLCWPSSKAWEMEPCKIRIIHRMNRRFLRRILILIIDILSNPLLRIAHIFTEKSHLNCFLYHLSHSTPSFLSWEEFICICWGTILGQSLMASVNYHLSFLNKVLY